MKFRPALLIGTRKGAFIYIGDASRRSWRLEGPHFLGSIVQHLVCDPRDGKTLLMASRDGHLGPTVFRSTNWGKTWQEAQRPPAFAKAKKGKKAKAVKAVFWLTPGHADEPGIWYAGTVPHGLFRSEDGGANWEPVKGFNEHPKLATWTGEDADGAPPEGPFTHSILVDPRDAQHLYLGLSAGGIFESPDAGLTWQPLNLGVAMDFMPPPPKGQEYEYGHDPHCLVQHPTHPDRLYHQNHCGIYRLDRPDVRWQRIGRKMPKSVGDIGFPMVVHPRDPDTAWVFPMDGTSVWPRTSPGGNPAVYVTRNAGRSWQRQDKGLPPRHAWWTVKRQAFCADTAKELGLYFGTTSGEIWSSRSGGASWSRLAAHLPHIYSVTTALKG